MDYIFTRTIQLSLVSDVSGRERIFFVNQELAKTEDMLAGVMHYKKGADFYLGPSATIEASGGALKLFVLVVPNIPK